MRRATALAGFQDAAVPAGRQDIFLIKNGFSASPYWVSSY
jgi:hypothetical protein